MDISPKAREGVKTMAEQRYRTPSGGYATPSEYNARARSANARGGSRMSRMSYMRVGKGGKAYFTKSDSGANYRARGAANNGG